VSPKHIPLLVCALAALTATAGAQFTAAVVPPAAKANVDTTAKKDSVRRATVALAARVTDMRKWVDSAASVSIPGGDSTALASNSSDTSSAHYDSAHVASHRRDSTTQRRDSVTLSRNAHIRSDSAAKIATVEVHDSTGLEGADSASSAPQSSGSRSRADARASSGGATAPATATMLPFLAIAGVTTLLAGLALRRW
jgi:hypothetical protein